MSAVVAKEVRGALRIVQLQRKHVPLVVTGVLFLGLMVFGALSYPGFLAPQVFLNLLIDNAFLLICAVGMTFVILTGGIDLSTGALMALTTVVSALLLARGHNPLVVMPLVVLLGGVFGGTQGIIVERLGQQPFLVTLGGMFLARGLSSMLTTESISITEPLYVWIAQVRIPLFGDVAVSVGALLALGVVAAGMWLAQATTFGRTVYAIGGAPAAAALMGLPVRSTLIGVYALSGMCAALAGIVMTFYMLSGYGLHGVGLELDAIAAVVIGGTLLRGGVGYVAGSLFGVLILGIVLTLITFDGGLNSWWTRIVTGALLLGFCLLQRLLAGPTR